jgi:hypothetical protein
MNLSSCHEESGKCDVDSKNLIKTLINLGSIFLIEQKALPENNLWQFGERHIL